MSTTHPYGRQIQEAIKVIARAGAEVAALLSQYPELNSITIGVIGSLNKPLFMLHGLVGTYPTENLLDSASSAGYTEEIAASGPVTSFFGTPVTQRKPVNQEDLTPSNDLKEKFIKERDELFSNFLDLSDNQVFQLALQPNGEALIRSVAKKALLPEWFYREHAIDTEFIEEIKKKLEEIKALDEDTRKAQERMMEAKHKASTETEEAPEQKDEQIDGNSAETQEEEQETTSKARKKR